MIFSSKSILIFENQVDLKHLASSLDNLEIAYSFVQSKESFIDKCNETRFDLLVISNVNEGLIDEGLFDSISASRNITVPVLAIVLDNKELLDQVLSHQINFILFPVKAEEFTHRIEQILRRSVAEKAIHLNLLGIRSILDNIPVGLIQTDIHGKFLTINREFAMLMKMTENNLFKENFFQLCHPDDYFIERKQLDRLLKKEERKVQYELRLINDEGKTSVCRLQASVLWKDEDIFDSFLLIVEELV